MLPTPSTSHVDVDRVYEPAEDSFLLLDTLSSASETEFLKHRFSAHTNEQPSPAPLVFEVGTGSGVVLAFVTANAEAIFGRTDLLNLGIDINRTACEATNQTVVRACKDTHVGKPLGSAVFLASLNANLGTSIRPGTVDMLIFNPPYVPTPELPIPNIGGEGQERNVKVSGFDSDSHLLSFSYSGGVDGMEVTDKLLLQLPSLLSSDRGVAYIVLCKQNKPAQVIRRLRDWGSAWSVEVVNHSGKTGGWEKLQIIRLCRT